MSPRVPLPTGGGTFDATESCTYFLAGDPAVLQLVADNGYRHVLVAVNELGDDDFERLSEMARRGVKILLDSGVFDLSSGHARREGIPLNVALGTAPEGMAGFAELRARYVRAVRTLHRDLWGFVEIDQGGIVHKRRIRRALEDELGMSPIPVYHPFTDGWDYFDELAESYDRVCISNLVQAGPHDRKRLIATAWERRRRYPHLWLHLLGVTPSHLLMGLPMNSCDSSTWLSAVRHGAQSERAALRSMGHLHPEFRYKIGTDTSGSTGRDKAIRLASAVAWSMERNWAQHRRAMRELGEPDCPPLTPRRERRTLQHGGGS